MNMKDIFKIGRNRMTLNRIIHEEIGGKHVKKVGHQLLDSSSQQMYNIVINQ